MVKSARASMMWAIHVRMGVAPRNLVASMFALNVRESRHIAITSSMIQQVCMCVRMHSYVKQQTCISAPETRVIDDYAPPSFQRSTPLSGASAQTSFHA